MILPRSNKPHFPSLSHLFLPMIHKQIFQAKKTRQQHLYGEIFQVFYSEMKYAMESTVIPCPSTIEHLWIFIKTFCINMAGIISNTPGMGIRTIFLINSDKRLLFNILLPQGPIWVENFNNLKKKQNYKFVYLSNLILGSNLDYSRIYHCHSYMYRGHCNGYYWC